MQQANGTAEIKMAHVPVTADNFSKQEAGQPLNWMIAFIAN